MHSLYRTETSKTFKHELIIWIWKTKQVNGYYEKGEILRKMMCKTALVCRVKECHGNSYSKDSKIGCVSMARYCRNAWWKWHLRNNHVYCSKTKIEHCWFSAYGLFNQAPSNINEFISYLFQYWIRSVFEKDSDSSVDKVTGLLPGEPRSRSSILGRSKK